MSKFIQIKGRAAQELRGFIPLLLVLLVMPVLLWLPWRAQQVEIAERQAELISDTLWLEQAITFQLSRNEEIVQQVARDVVQARQTRAEAMARFRQLLKSNYEIHRIDWLDPAGKVIDSTSEGVPLPSAYLPLLRANAMQVANPRTINCLPPVPETGTVDSYLLTCQILLTPQHTPAASVLVSYRLQGILDDMVPWWFAQANQLTLQDGKNRVLAMRASGGEGQHVISFKRAVEFSGLTLYLHVDSNRGAPRLLSNLLVVSVLVLMVGLTSSLIALWRDVNRRRAAEVALRQQVAFRRAMEDSLMTGLRARDMEGRLTYVNPAFCAMVGFPAEEIIGRVPPMPYWAEESMEEYRIRFTQLLSGHVPDKGFELIYQRANGERFTALIHESPLVDEHGQQTGWMSSILDISELKRAQELARAQQEKLDTSARLATVGEIGSMLAHELNQPLAAISSYTTGAMNMIAAGKLDPALLSGALQKASDQAQRAGTIIRSVHEFVRKREAKREWLDIGQLITIILPLVELQAKAAHVPLQCKIASDLPLVSADKTLLEQVLLNLTRNAIEAMQTCPVGERQLGLHALQDGEMLRVEVSDRGTGISFEHAAKLFTPFFSTKQNGMGMGLNVCRTAIEFHGGRLEHRDNPAGGTIFSFSLPLTEPATPSHAIEATNTTDSGRIDAAHH